MGGSGRGEMPIMRRLTWPIDGRAADRWMEGGRRRNEDLFLETVAMEQTQTDDGKTDDSACGLEMNRNP